MPTLISILTLLPLNHRLHDLDRVAAFGNFFEQNLCLTIRGDVRFVGCDLSYDYQVFDGGETGTTPAVTFKMV